MYCKRVLGAWGCDAFLCVAPRPSHAVPQMHVDSGKFLALSTVHKHPVHARVLPLLYKCSTY